MKSFLDYLKEEPRAAGFVRYYALTQKKRLEDQRKYIEGKASEIQDFCNAGLQQEDIAQKINQIFIVFFYLAHIIKKQGEMESATLNAALTHFLAPTEINANLEKYPKPKDEPTSESKKSGTRKKENAQ
jgi:hypothetical protein